MKYISVDVEALNSDLLRIGKHIKKSCEKVPLVDRLSPAWQSLCYILDL